MDPKSRMPKKPGVPPARPGVPQRGVPPVKSTPPAHAPHPGAHAPVGAKRPTSSVPPPRSNPPPLHRTLSSNPNPPSAAGPKRISGRTASHVSSAPTATVEQQPKRISTRSAPQSSPRGPSPISARISKSPLPLKPEIDDAELENDIEVTPTPSPSALVTTAPEPVAAPAPVKVPEPRPAPAPVQKPVATADADADGDDLDDYDEDELDGAELPAPGLPHKKIVMGLIGVIAVLLCLIAGLLIKKYKSSSGGGDVAQLRVDGGDPANPNTPGTPGSRVAGPLVPEFQKKHPRSTHNLLLASDGAVATGGQKPEVLIDGIADNYDPGLGYATTNNNEPKEQFLITLKEPRELTRVRFLLWDKDPRSFRYILSVSPDGKNFKKVQDNSKRESQSWQEVRFARQKVKVVALRGIASTANDSFHAVEIEGYDDGAESDKFTRRAPLKGPMKSAASSLKPGVWAEFFDTVDTYAAIEDTPQLTRPQPSLAFGASTPAPPGQGIHDWPFGNACAANFTGYVKIEKQGLYTFFVESENGARLYLDGELLINNDGDHKLQELWEQIDLSTGLHRIYVEYYTYGAATGLTCSIKPKGESKEYLSDKWLCYDPLEVTGVDPESRRPADAPREAAKPYVKFIGRNDKRGGNWKREMGKDGYVLFNKGGGGQHLQKLPPYIASHTTAADDCVWNQGEEPRELEDPEGKGPRLGACEYSGSEVLIDLRASKSIVNHLSMYFLDFDKLGRKDHIQFFSGDEMLYETDVGDFGNGSWLEFEVAGSLMIKLQNACNTNAVVSGVFWDSEHGLHFKTPPKGPPTTAMKPGVIGEYYDQLPLYATDDDTPTIARLEPTLAFGATPPPTAERILHGWPLAGAFSAVYRGVINIPADDKYAFSLTSDDGSRFFIDGEKLIDNDGPHGMKEVEAAIDLKAGPHRIWLEWFNGGGPYGMNLLMKQKDGKKVPIPAEWLGHE